MGRTTLTQNCFRGAREVVAVAMLLNEISSKTLANPLLFVNLYSIKQCTMEVDHRIFNDNFRDQSQPAGQRLRKFRSSNLPCLPHNSRLQRTTHSPL
uniref:Uncharacterized protein n=1 Tax=Knipowitschia caucasica TaxID=637954 RepID=A0AAV2MS81_KNICA